MGEMGEFYTLLLGDEVVQRAIRQFVVEPLNHHSENTLE